MRPALPDPAVRHLIRTLIKDPRTIAELTNSEHATSTQIFQTVHRARIAGLTIVALPTRPTTYRFDPPT